MNHNKPDNTIDEYCNNLVGKVMLVRSTQFPFYDQRNTPYLEKGSAVVISSYEGGGNFICQQSGFYYPIHEHDLMMVQDDTVGAIRYYTCGELGLPIPKEQVREIVNVLLELLPDLLLTHEEEDIAYYVARMLNVVHSVGTITVPGMGVVELADDEELLSNELVERRAMGEYDDGTNGDL